MISPMIAAVTAARCKSLDQIASNVPSRTAALAASRRPSSLSGTSAAPCQRPSAFHSLSPWRTTSRRVEVDVAGPGGIHVESSCAGTLRRVAILRLFASAREAAGRSRDEIAGDTVGDVLAAASERYGST